MTSVLKMLTNQQIVSSTIDPANGDTHPSGLVYVKSAPFGGHAVKKGDLVVCNYSDSNGVAGNGTTLEVMASTPGSSPKTYVQDPKVKGCASLVINSYDQIYSSDSIAKNLLGIQPNAKINQTITSNRFTQPWSTAYMPSFGYPPGDGIFVSDITSGKILRVDLGAQKPKPPVTAIISGFAVSGSQPGSLLGPSGVLYAGGSRDTLYICDAVTNTIVSVVHAYDNLHAVNSIVIGADGKTFSGPKKSLAHLVYSGHPLNAPMTATLLPNGNLVVGNGKGPNMLVEIASNGKLLATKTLGKGAGGAIGGLASSGASDATTKIYFNNDNANNVQVLSK